MRYRARRSDQWKPCSTARRSLRPRGPAARQTGGRPPERSGSRVRSLPVNDDLLNRASDSPVEMHSQGLHRHQSIDHQRAPAAPPRVVTGPPSTNPATRTRLSSAQSSQRSCNPCAHKSAFRHLRISGLVCIHVVVNRIFLNNSQLSKRLLNSSRFFDYSGSF
jgi:hypothetical protein